jgi:hypothetical protein
MRSADECLVSSPGQSRPIALIVASPPLGKRFDDLLGSTSAVARY